MKNLRTAKSAALSFLWAASAAVSIVTLARPAAAATIDVPMTESRWTTSGFVTFDAPDDSFPLGRMEIKKGNAAPKALRFGSGTIEFDAKIGSKGPALGPDFEFRTNGPATADLFYVRPSPDCAAAFDCLQYTPITHGLMLWDAFRRYQHSAPIVLDGWNHFKLVVSESRMDVYVNRETAPSLVVGRLEGDATRGGLLIDGAGSYANFTVSPGDVGGLAEAPARDPAADDPNYVRRWLVSPPQFRPAVTDPTVHAVVGKTVTAADLPASRAGWKPVTVERAGLLNLSRVYGLQTVGSKISLVWARTHVYSDRDRVVRVSIGFLDEVWVFANGKRVYADRNLWDVDGAKKAPDGRLGIDNGSFDLPLHAGDNVIDAALDDQVADGNRHHFGWGIEMRFDDLHGLRLPATF